MRGEKHVFQYCMELCVNWRCCSCTSSIIISEIIDLLLDIARLAKLLSSKLKYLNLQLFKSAKGKTLYFCCKLLKNQSSYKSLFWTVKYLPFINITGRKKSLVFVLDFHSILFFFPETLIINIGRLVLSWIWTTLQNVVNHCKKRKQ